MRAGCARLAIKDADLRIARDHLLSAQKHLILALGLVKSVVKDGSQKAPQAGSKYKTHIDDASTEVKSYGTQCHGFLVAHDLTQSSP